MADALLMAAFSHTVMPIPASPTNWALDATNDGIAWSFQPYSADPITHLGFRIGAKVGTNLIVYSIRLEGLDTSGLPNNTDSGGGSPTAVTFTPPADTSIDGLWQWKTLTNAYTPTRGQFLAATIRYSSGSVDSSNHSTITRHFANHLGVTGYPTQLLLSAGSWSKNALGTCFGWRTASGRYGAIIENTYTTNTAATSGHKSMMHFTLPSGHGDTFQVLGFRATDHWPAAAGTFKAVLLQADGTVLQDVTIDTDVRSTVNSTQGDLVVFDESTLATLSYGTKYYIGLESTGTAVGMRCITLAEAADRSAYPNGTNRGLVTFDGSTYTETDTALPLLDLIMADITEPSGGGGNAYVIGG